MPPASSPCTSPRTTGRSTWSRCSDSLSPGNHYLDVYWDNGSYLYGTPGNTWSAGASGGYNGVGSSSTTYTDPVTSLWSVTTSADGQTKYFTFKWKVKPGYGNVQNVPLQAEVNIGGNKRWIQDFNGPSMNVLPTVSLSAAPTLVGPGQPSTLTWSSAVASTVTISPGIGNVSASGTRTVNPTTDTTYTITASNSTGSAAASAVVRVDGTVPTTVITPSAQQLGTWTRSKPVTFVLAATDNSGGMGVANTYYKLGGSATTTYTGTVSVSAENTTVVSYWSVDKGGNKEATKTANIQIDTTKPSITGTTTTQPNAADWFKTNVTVHFTATDSGSGVAAVGSDVVLTAEGRALGASGAATDVAGNVATISVGGINIDKTPPLTSSDATASYVGTATIQLTPIDNLSGTAATYYSFDGGFTVYAGTTITTTTPGAYTLRYWSADAAGNAELPHEVVFVRVNEAPTARPSVSPTSGPAPLTVGFDGASSSDPDGSIVHYRWDFHDGTWADSITATKTYESQGSYVATLTVTDNLGASAAGTAGIEVAVPLPTASVSATPSLVTIGVPTTISWSSSYAASVTILPNIGSVPASGSITATPAADTTYTIVATNASGEARATAFVKVNPPLLPAVSFTAAPLRILLGQPCVLSWTTQRSDAVMIDHGIGIVTSSGSTNVSPLVDTTYTITASNASGVTTAALRVDVTPVASQPATSFGVGYQDLIPEDATVTVYDASRFSVITGLIRGLSMQPLPGVRVSVPSCSGYGSVLTDSDGRFALPVEGGKDWVLQFEKIGFLTAQRVVNVPWNEVVTCETVLLVEQGTSVKTIDFGPGQSLVETYSSQSVSDNRGIRNTTLVFREATKAWATGADGIEREVSSLNVRGSEFTTDQALPGRLPQASAFTYCIDLSADGYGAVRFDKTVLAFTRNFPEFPVGTVVPSGYYDLARQVWVPSDNGVVVRLLDYDRDGVVDSLDTTGAGEPGYVLSNETTGAQAAGLQDPNTYHPGDTYWCVPIQHFSPWDWNWPWYLDEGSENPTVAPQAEVCRQSGSCVAERGTKQIDKTHIGSTVDNRRQVFEEDLPVAGTGLTFHYSSERSDARNTRIAIPVTGSTLASGIRSVWADVNIAGRTYHGEWAPRANIRWDLTWDGTDFRGRKLTGTVPLHVKVSYQYPVRYGVPVSGRRAFGISGSSAVAWYGSGVNDWIPLFNAEGASTLNIDRPVATADKLGNGWSLDVHHAIDSKLPQFVQKGDGGKVERRVGYLHKVLRAGYQIRPVVDSKGTVYYTNADGSWLYRLDATTHATTYFVVPGGGGAPTAAFVDRNDAVYVRNGNGQLWRRETTGSWMLVSGNGSASGEVATGTSAVHSPISASDAAIDANGSIYIADANRCMVWKIDGGGVVSPLAGNGYYAHSGDGSAAVSASLSGIAGLAADNRGNVYISTYQGIRKVDPAGIITTPWTGYVGTLAADSTGYVYVPGFSAHLVYRLAEGRPASVFAGASTGSTSDGIPATLAYVGWPTAVAIGPEGVYIASTADNGMGELFKVSWGNFEAQKLGNGDFQVNDDNGLAYVFSADGRHRRTIDARANTALVSFGYNGSGALGTVTDRFGNVVTISRDATGTALSIVGAYGDVTSLTVDSMNNLRKVGYSDGGEYSFDYDGRGLLTAKRDPAAGTSAYDYDADGSVYRTTDAERNTWDFSRQPDPFGSLVSTVHSAEGNTTTYVDRSFADGSSMTTITNPAGATTRFSQTSGQMTATRDLPGGIHQTFSYGWDDAFGQRRLTSATSAMPSGLTRTVGARWTYTDTNGDGKRDLFSDTIIVNGRESTVTQNASAGSIVAVSPTGRTTSSTYDTATLLPLHTSLPGLFALDYQHDARGRLATLTVGDRTAAYSYDDRGRLATATGPDGRSTTYTYDPLGRPLTAVRPDGSAIGYRYDVKGEVTALISAAPATSTFTYAGTGQRQTFDPAFTGTISYTYDKEHNLKTVTLASGALISNTYTYGQLTDIAFPNGQIRFERGR